MKVSSTIMIAALMAVSITVAQAAVTDIKTLSSRPDRVSGGDVLVQITRSDDAALSVTLNGADVSKSFTPGSVPHTMVGLVSGLKQGDNTLTAGGTAAFSVVAGGTAPLTYQWLLNGSPVIDGSGGTTSLYFIPYVII